MPKNLAPDRSRKASLTSPREMKAILQDKALLRSLRSGHEQAKRRQGRLAK